MSVLTTYVKVKIENLMSQYQENMINGKYQAAIWNLNTLKTITNQLNNLQEETKK